MLLRGLTREAAHWGDLPQRLADASGAPVVTPDLPGAGALHAVTSPALVAGLLGAVQAAVQDAVRATVPADLRAGLPACPLAPPWRVLGLSLGGMVATAWAVAAPQELAALALVNTSLRPFSGVTQRLRPRHWPTMVGLLVGLAVAARGGEGRGVDRAEHGAGQAEPGAGAQRCPQCSAQHVARDVGDAAVLRAQEARVLALTSRRHWTDDERQALLADWVAVRRARPVSAPNALRQLIAAARYTAPRRAPGQAGQAPLPIRILGSAGDQLVSPACSQALAVAWGLPLLQHPWAGHDLPLDDPDWLIAQLLQPPPGQG